MSIDIEQLAKEWIKQNLSEGGDCCEIAFLAGYQAAKDQLADMRNYLEKAFQAGHLFMATGVDFDEWYARVFLAKDQLADTDKAMNSPEKQDSWISVKERLPQINKGFIGFVENKEVCNCYRYPNRSSDDSPVFYAQCKLGLLIGDLEIISHWMPLPEAPKKEK